MYIMYIMYLVTIIMLLLINNSNNLLFFVVIDGVYVIEAIADDNNNNNNKVIDNDLNYLISKRNSQTGIVIVENYNFTKLLLKNNKRNFNVVLLFSISPTHKDQYKCHSCPDTEKTYMISAKSYLESISNNNENTEIIFAQVFYPNSDKVFYEEKVETIPVIGFYPHSKSRGEIKNPWKISDQEEVVEFLGSPEKLIGAIKSSFGISFNLSYEINDYRYHLLFFGTLLSIYFYSVMDSPIISTILIFRSRRFYLFMSLLVYAVSVSGTIYCIISNSAWFFGDMDSGAFAIMSQSDGRRSQTVLEGFLAAGLYLSFSFLIILLVTFDAGSISIPCTRNKNSIPNRILQYFASYIVPIVLITFATFFISTIIKNVYTKNQWADPFREFEEGFGMDMETARKRFLINIKNNVGASNFDMIYLPLKKFFDENKNIKFY